MEKDQKALLVRGDEAGQSASSVLYKYLLLVQGAVQNNCLLISTQIKLRKIKAKLCCCSLSEQEPSSGNKKKEILRAHGCVSRYTLRQKTGFYFKEDVSLFLKTYKISSVCWNNNNFQLWLLYLYRIINYVKHKLESLKALMETE